jgi:hypothetical protein
VTVGLTISTLEVLSIAKARLTLTSRTSRTSGTLRGWDVAHLIARCHRQQSANMPGSYRLVLMLFYFVGNDIVG